MNMQEELLHYSRWQLLGSIGVRGNGGSGDISKMLKFTLQTLCDRQGAERQAILYTGRSCLCLPVASPKKTCKRGLL